MEKKHSILGIISLSMPITSALLYWGLFWLYNLSSIGGKLTPPPNLTAIFIFALPPIGLIFAIFAIVRKKKNPLFPIIGLAFNSVAILLEALFIITMINIG